MSDNIQPRIDWTPTPTGACIWSFYNDKDELIASGTYGYENKSHTLYFHTEIKFTNSFTFTFQDGLKKTPTIYISTNPSLSPKYSLIESDLISWEGVDASHGSYQNSLLNLKVPKNETYYLYVPYMDEEDSSQSTSSPYSTDLNSFPTSQIQISCSTPDSQIYYTLDNSTPDSSKSLYSNQFEVESGTTIKAIAVKDGYIDSDIAEYTVN